MFRDLLFFALGGGCALAATITTQVNCNGEVSTGAAAASCSHALSHASASISETSLYQDRVGFGVQVFGGEAATVTPPFVFVAWSASATFQDDYLLTVTGGSGAGSIKPCMSTFWNAFRGGADIEIGFGNSGLGIGFPSFGSNASCPGPSQVALVPFTFGVPQIISVSMSARASGAFPSDVSVFGGLSSLQFFDNAGNQITDVHFTLISTTVPEPGTGALLLLGLFFLLTGGRRYCG
jgi:hypothetical protein